MAGEMQRTEMLYDNAGARRQMILTERDSYVRNVRRLMTEIEFEVMQDVPDSVRINSLSKEARIILEAMEGI